MTNLDLIRKISHQIQLNVDVDRHFEEWDFIWLCHFEQKLNNLKKVDTYELNWFWNKYDFSERITIRFEKMKLSQYVSI